MILPYFQLQWDDSSNTKAFNVYYYNCKASCIKHYHGPFLSQFNLDREIIFTNQIPKQFSLEADLRWILTNLDVRVSVSYPCNIFSFIFSLQTGILYLLISLATKCWWNNCTRFLQNNLSFFLVHFIENGLNSMLD